MHAQVQIPRIHRRALDERERLGRIVAGDREAFADLVRDYHPLAYSLAYGVLADSQDAEEVVQDAFVKIYRALENFRFEASFKTWMLRIVMRLSLNRRRDRARTSWYRLGLHQGGAESGQQALREARSAHTPESLCIARETRRRVLHLIDELPEELRQALVLNSIEELSYEEIARILDIPVGTVGSRIHSARRKLLQKLEHREAR